MVIFFFKYLNSPSSNLLLVNICIAIIPPTIYLAGIANTIAVLKSTNPFWIFLMAPTKADVPTTNKEYAVAVTGFIDKI